MKSDSNSNLGTAAYGLAALVFVVALLGELGLNGIFVLMTLAGIAMAAWKYKQGNLRGVVFGFGLAISAVLLLIFLKIK